MIEQMSVDDLLYQKYVDKLEPIRLMCKCGWKGNKPKVIKFKKVEPKTYCPDCGDSVHITAELVFWRTANGDYKNRKENESCIK